MSQVVFTPITTPTGTADKVTLYALEGSPDRLAYKIGTSTEVVLVGSAGGGLAWSVVSTATNAAAGNGYLVDCSAGTVAITLPASPSAGDAIAIADYSATSATYNITIGRNGGKINGASEDFTLEVNGASVHLVYGNSTYGWRVVLTAQPTT
jgi:hypothetical protein